MTHDSDIYIVDTNALSKIRRIRRSTTFFRENVKIISEVLYEAQDSPDINNLRDLEYQTSPAVLRKLLEVMSSIPSEDTTLIDLYKNLGGADPLLIACSLVENARLQQFIFGNQAVIVSDDRAVQKKAIEFGLPFIDSATFSQIIDANSR